MINPWHFILVIPVAQREVVNLAAEVMGYGPDNLSVPLVTPPGETITHFATALPGSDGFKALVEAAKAGTLPDGVSWEDYGTTAQAVIDAFAQLEISAEPRGQRTPLTHFFEFVGALGLSAIHRERED